MNYYLKRVTAFGGKGIVIVCVLAVGIAFADTCNAQAANDGVHNAIERGISFLKSKELAEGGFDSRYSSKYPQGVAALSLWALIHSGVPTTDRTVRKTEIFLRHRANTKTYSAALKILALDTMNDPKCERAIKEAAQWLVEQFRVNEHAWGYPDGTPDLSNTQFAILGIWIAQRHGFQAPSDLWWKLSHSIVQHQNGDGGFGYRSGRESTGSMTVAGIAVLSLCREMLLQKRKQTIWTEKTHKALESGWDYMARRYRTDGNPCGQYMYTIDNFLYYLFGLERACAICDRGKVGDIDWYSDCAPEILAQQRDDGSWNGRVVDTCFALLVLRRATHAIFDRDTEPDLAITAETELRDVLPLHHVPYIKTWLVLGPIDDSDESGLFTDIIDEKKVDPIPGRQFEDLTWCEYRSPTQWIDHDLHFAKNENVLAYAFTRLCVQVETDAVIWFGSDDGARIWLDGELIHHRPFRGRDAPDAHSIPVHLRKGVHRLLVKVVETSRSWGFYLRVTRSDGGALLQVIPHCDAKHPQIQDIFNARAPFLSYAEVFDLIPRDKNLKLRFDSTTELSRIFVSQCYDRRIEHSYRWVRQISDLAKAKPVAEATGMIRVHPCDKRTPARIFRKVRITSPRTRIKLRVAACNPCLVNDNPDWIASIGVFADGKMDWLRKYLVYGGDESYPVGWKDIEVELRDYAGKDVLLVLECAAGGLGGHWDYEHAFIDEFSVERF